MNIIIAPDSFKECLSAKEVAAHISKGIFQVMPKAVVREIPISDGGEGILDVLVEGVGGTYVSIKVFDPLLRKVDSQYGILKDNKTAIIEMAKASGLELLKEEEKNPMITTTYGTGQLIKDALDKGCTKIIIGIGGSATNDAGVGMLKALGAKFLDKNGKSIPEGGVGLSDLEKIDLSNFDERIRNCEFVVACDVSNPLTGINGASFVYGAQKGGNNDDLKVLDGNLEHFANIIKSDLKIDIANAPGAGAAGGTGAALMAFMNGELEQGVNLILETLGIEEFVERADLIFTGEGKIDEQTLNGKTIAGISKLAKKHNVPVIVITGKIGENIEGMYDLGVKAIYSIVNQPMPLQKAIDDAPLLIQQCVSNVMRTIKQFRLK
jgi:glycerate kinase